MKHIHVSEFLDHTPLQTKLSFTDEHAFLNLLQPVLIHCQSQINASIPAELTPYIKYSCFAEYLLSEFKTICTPMLSRVCVFELHAAREKSFLQGATPSECFQYFINEIVKPENARALFKKYPELEKQLDSAINQLMVVTQELILRFAADRQELYQRYLDDTFKLCHITVTGDKHQQGHSVLILEFNSSVTVKKIVYKPRSLDIDQQFEKLIAWCNQYFIETDLIVPNVLSKSQYGWMEYIPHDECHSENEFKYYYQRLGQWLCLTYLLNGSDLHYENIIAHGAYPVVIDFECFFQPFFNVDVESNQKHSRHLVTETAFLPQKVLMHDQKTIYDVSILGIETIAIQQEVVEWESSGTDAMQLKRVRKPLADFYHRPVFQAIAAKSSDYYNDFIIGFERVYQLVLQNTEEFEKQLNQFSKVRVRVLFRNTATYAKLMAESFHPTLLINEDVRAKHFSWLHQQNIQLGDKVFNAELADLSSNDIPIFYAYSDGDKLYDSYHHELDIPVIITGLQWVTNNLINNVNAKDLLLQKRLMQNSFAAVQIQAQNKMRIDLPSAATAWLHEKINQFALDHARKQMDYLADTVIVNRGRVFWPTIKPINETLWNASFTDIYLYDGIAGIALSFAYAAKIFNDARYKDIAQQCLQSVRDTLARQQINIKSIGAFSGLSGILYAFIVFYKLWRDDSIKNDIALILNRLTECLPQEKEWDIVSGSTGCLVVLLRLQDVFPEIDVKNQLTHCVESILQNPTLAFSQNPLVGFSHGVSGVIWALEQYQYHYANPEVKKWIVQAREYEKNYFDSERGNWLDLRTNDFMTAWCHGAAGIALLRLDSASGAVDTALATTLREGFHGGSCLCHGDLGNLEVFLSAGLQHRETFHMIATQVMQKIEKHGVSCGKISTAIHPGLMTGVAGVAYEFMRIAHPDVVPAVLLLKV